MLTKDAALRPSIQQLLDHEWLADLMTRPEGPVGTPRLRPHTPPSLCSSYVVFVCVCGARDALQHLTDTIAGLRKFNAWRKLRAAALAAKLSANWCKTTTVQLGSMLPHGDLSVDELSRVRSCVWLRLRRCLLCRPTRAQRVL